MVQALDQVLLLLCSIITKTWSKQLVQSRDSSTKLHFDLKMAAHLRLRYIMNRQTMQTQVTQEHLLQTAP